MTPRLLVAVGDGRFDVGVQGCLHGALVPCGLDPLTHLHRHAGGERHHHGQARDPPGQGRLGQGEIIL